MLPLFLCNLFFYVGALVVCGSLALAVLYSASLSWTLRKGLKTRKQWNHPHQRFVLLALVSLAKPVLLLFTGSTNIGGASCEVMIETVLTTFVPAFAALSGPGAPPVLDTGAANDTAPTGRRKRIAPAGH